MPKEEYLRWVATEVEKAITTFRPHMVFYISGSSPADPTQGNASPPHHHQPLVFRFRFLSLL